MTYPPATIARRLACGVCPLCDDPGKPVAARQGFTHEHAILLCLEHLLAALGLPIEPPKADAPTNDGSVRAAFRASLRVHAPHDASPSAVTHARQMPVRPLDPESLAAALLVMRELGAVPLRAEPTYGGESEPLPYVGPATPMPGLQVILPTGAPAAARRMALHATEAGWRVRGWASTSDCSLYAARGGVRVDVHWSDGRFRSAWVATGAGCVKVGARQAAAILKGG